MTLVGETSCVRHSVDYGHTPGLQYPALDDYGRKKGQKPCIYWAFWPFLDYFGLVSGGRMAIELLPKTLMVELFLKFFIKIYPQMCPQPNNAARFRTLAAI